MKTVLAILVLLTAAAAGAMFWLMQHAGGMTFAEMVLDADLLVKLAILAQSPLFLLALLLGFIGLLQKPQPGGGKPLKVLAFVAPLPGLLAAIYNGLRIQTAAAKFGVTDLRVVAPGLAEGLLPLAWGLATATVAVAFLMVLRARAKRAGV